MKTVICVGLLVCACISYVSAQPIDVVNVAPETETDTAEETLVPAESHYRRWGGHRYGWGPGYGGHYGGGYGFVGGFAVGHGVGFGRGFGGGYGGGYGWGR